MNMLRLQQEGRELIAQFMLEKKHLSSDDPMCATVDQKIAQITAGILDLEVLLREQERSFLETKVHPTSNTASIVTRFLGLFQ